jgi:hypothetical protein
MRGQAILARTMSVATRRGNSTKPWQYHSRSDHHSKLACWTLLFDLLLECDALRRAARQGRIGFGINHVMVGPINKTLDLVVTIVPPGRPKGKRRSFSDLGAEYGVALEGDDRVRLNTLPRIEEDKASDISEVAIALEAKACMTEHVKSLPRLHAEILATGYLARRASARSIVVSYSLVNAAGSFVTPSGSGNKVNAHHQPGDSRRVVDMIATAIPMVGDVSAYGYDVVGITVVECANDGTEVRVIEDPTLAPTRSAHTHYERMVRSLCSEFRGRFGR